MRRALLLLLLAPGFAQAATRFWVGGTATWDGATTANWAATSGGASGVSVPTAADDVFLDAASGAVTVTLSSSSLGRSLDCTGFTGTLSHPALVTLLIGDSGLGASSNALIFPAAGMVYTIGSATTSIVKFISTNVGVQNVSFGGLTAGNVTFDGAAGSWLLTGAFASAATSTLSVLTGTLNTNGQVINCGLFTSTGAATRALVLGASTITVTGTGTPFDIVAGGLTLTANTSIINVTGASGRFSGANKTYNTVNMQNSAGFVVSGSTVITNLNFTGSGTKTIQNAITLTNLTVTGTASPLNILSTNIVTVSGALTINGNSQSNRLLWQSSSVSIARIITITGATVSASNVDFMDITFSVATNLSAITGGSGDCGGNSGITLSTPSTNFWVGNAGSWSDAANHWASTSGGAAGTGHSPLCQDSATFDANSFTLAGQTVLGDIPRIGKDVSFAAVTNSPTVDITLAYDIYGSLTLASAMTWIPEQATTWRCRIPSCTVTSAGHAFDQAHGWNFTMPGGTLTLQDDMSAAQAGPLAHYGSFALNVGTVILNGHNMASSQMLSGSTGPTAIDLGTGTWTLADNNGATPSTINLVAGTVITASASSIVVIPNIAATYTFNMQGKTFGNIRFENPLAGITYKITGSNTFANFTMDAGVTMQFTSATTQTVTGLTCTGTSVSPITWSATTAASAATIRKTSGLVSCNWMVLKDSTATGGATFYAGTNSTNVSGNTGWSFTSPPSGNFTASPYICQLTCGRIISQ